MKNQNDKQKELLRKEYTLRINKVIDFIDQHLDEELNLETLSNVSNFSKFHFHRIFSAFMGETLNQFIKRLRVEKAAAILRTKAHESINNIALDCGFSSASVFSRAFKQHFNMSASDYRKAIEEEESKNSQKESNFSKVKSNFWQERISNPDYLDTDNQLRSYEMKVEIKDLAEKNVAYFRHIGPYIEIGKTFDKVNTWAAARGLFEKPETQFLGVYNDDPKVTEADKLRSSACVTVPNGFKVDGDAGEMTVSGGKYAVAHCEVLINEFEDAYQTLIGGWLPESGYQIDDRDIFEVYLNEPDKHPEGKFVVDICIPVKAL